MLYILFSIFQGCRLVYQNGGSKIMLGAHATLKARCNILRTLFYFWYSVIIEEVIVQHETIRKIKITHKKSAVALLFVRALSSLVWRSVFCLLLFCRINYLVMLLKMERSTIKSGNLVCCTRIKEFSIAVFSR